MDKTTKLNSTSDDVKKTVSRSESGHAKNVVSFDELISIVTGFGATFNPSRAALKLPALQTQSTNAKNAAAALKTSHSVLQNAATAREVAFLPVQALVTRAFNSLKATDTSPQVAEKAQGVVRKIRGTRLSPKKTDAEKAALASEGKEVKEISTSQQSYDNVLDNLESLVTYLSGVTQYAPNEADLKVANLKTMLTDLKAKNTAVLTATTAFTNARNARNDIFYKEGTGMVDIAYAVKTYIKSAYGVKSSQYTQVASVKFKRPKK